MLTLRMSGGIPAWCPLEKKAAKPRSHRYLDSISDYANRELAPSRPRPAELRALLPLASLIERANTEQDRTSSPVGTEKRARWEPARKVAPVSTGTTQCNCCLQNNSFPSSRHTGQSPPSFEIWNLASASRKLCFVGEQL